MPTLTSTLPCSFSISPRKADRSEDLPAPTWPTTATSFPSVTPRLILQTNWRQYINILYTVWMVTNICWETIYLIRHWSIRTGRFLKQKWVSLVIRSPGSKRCNRRVKAAVWVWFRLFIDSTKCCNAVNIRPLSPVYAEFYFRLYKATWDDPKINEINAEHCDDNFTTATCLIVTTVIFDW